MNAPSRFKTETNSFSDFWQYEDGKRMLDELGSIPDLTLAQGFVPLLFKKDDLADSVIDDCFNGPFGAALQMVTDYLTGKLPINEAPESVRILRNEMTARPDWVNPELLDLGRQVCNRSGKSGLIVLRNYSLMLGYQSAAINKPLIATGALHSGAVKRIADTTSFWYAVTGKNALEVDQEGFVFCVRTRLVHAYSRIMIKQKLDWKINEQGEPLNYWDMIATYLGFSLVFMRGLKSLGMTISDQESRAVYHLWKYIGYLIGIPPQIMPADDNEAIRGLFLWSKTQPESDADSIALAQALHMEPIGAPWPPRLSQQKFIQQVNLAFNRHLIGQRSCDVLQLPPPNFPIMAKIVSTINKLDDRLASNSAKYRHWQITKGRADQLVIRNRVNM